MPVVLTRVFPVQLLQVVCTFYLSLSYLSPPLLFPPPPLHSAVSHHQGSSYPAHSITTFIISHLVTDTALSNLTIGPCNKQLILGSWPSQSAHSVVSLS